MKNAVLETERLVLRTLCKEDQASLNKMLQDAEVMYAYAHAFSDEEAREWLDRQLERYRQYGFGLWAVILKETGEFIGQCGLTMQIVRADRCWRWDIYSAKSSGITDTPQRQPGPAGTMLLRH